MHESGFYTGEGDRGDTVRLEGAERIAKSSALIEAVGTLDEATSVIGMARAQARAQLLKEILPAVQRHIYRLLSHLSAISEARGHFPGLTLEDVAWLEARIADLETRLPPLENFVLPGDSVSSATFHVARTVVRRAERRVAALAESDPSFGNPNLAYLNRLSSLLFVAALVEDLDEGSPPTLAKESGG